MGLARQLQRAAHLATFARAMHERTRTNPTMRNLEMTLTRDFEHFLAHVATILSRIHDLMLTVGIDQGLWAVRSARSICLA